MIDTGVNEIAKHATAMGAAFVGLTGLGMMSDVTEANKNIKKITNPAHRVSTTLATPNAYQFGGTKSNMRTGARLLNKF
jgi:hypothetical protein